MPRFQRDLGRYFARLLTRLGYRAALRVLPADPYFDAVYDPASRVQIGFNGWFPDYASASTFFEPNFGCTAPNLSHFCDRGVERAIRRALGARAPTPPPAGRRSTAASPISRRWCRSRTGGRPSSCPRAWETCSIT